MDEPDGGGYWGDSTQMWDRMKELQELLKGTPKDIEKLKSQPSAWKKLRKMQMIMEELCPALDDMNKKIDEIEILEMREVVELLDELENLDYIQELADQAEADERAARAKKAAKRAKKRAQRRAQLAQKQRLQRSKLPPSMRPTSLIDFGMAASYHR